MCLSTELGACNPSPANLIGKRSQPAMPCYLSCPTVIPSANLQRSSWLNDGDLICDCSSCRNLTTSIPRRVLTGMSCPSTLVTCCCRFFRRPIGPCPFFVFRLSQRRMLDLNRLEVVCNVCASDALSSVCSPQVMPSHQLCTAMTRTTLI